jgi:molecular chaperone GrpE
MVKIKENKKDDIVDEKVHELENKLTRALADYDNLRKRIDREKDKLFRFANRGVVERFLIIYDMLIQAQEHINDSGIAIIMEEFRKILYEEGVEEIEVKKGDKFDEDLFEAVEAEKASKGNEGKISEVILTGWKYKDGPVIREAKVKVYEKK